MNPYLEILRPLNGFIAVFAVIVTAILVGFYNPYQIILASIVVFLVSGAGMTINDYFDYKIDKINRPKRPIPSGRISRKNALYYIIALFVIANALAFLLNFYMFLFALFNTFITIIYSWRLKKVVLIGNFFVSWLVASSFLFASLLTEKITALILLLFIMAFSSNTSREIAKDIEDMKGDIKQKAKTLPILLGKNFASYVAIFFIIFALIFSILPYLFGLLNIYYIYIVLIADIIFIISCFLLFTSIKKSQRTMKIAMFIAIIAFLVGII